MYYRGGGGGGGVLSVFRFRPVQRAGGGGGGGAVRFWPVQRAGGRGGCAIRLRLRAGKKSIFGQIGGGSTVATSKTP